MRLNRIQAWLKPYTQGARLLQLFVYAIIFMVLVVYILSYPASLRNWRFYGTVICLSALLVLNILWGRPDSTAPPRLQSAYDWAFLVMSALIVLAAAWISAVFEVIYLFAIVCAQAGYRKGVWPVGVLFAAAILVVWVLLSSLLGLPAAAIRSMAFNLASAIIFGLLMITLLIRYSRQTERLEALLKELKVANIALEAALQKEKDLAIAEERIRLARDIHDGLGHHLTVLSIQLQAAGKLVERNPPAAEEAIQACRSEAQAALEEVRNSVRLMRQSPAESRPLPERLDSLLQGFNRVSDLHASLEISGTPLDLPLPAREAIFRAVQEGMTNAEKHAREAQNLAIRLVYSAEILQLLIEDDGQPVVQGVSASSPGFGLAGLHERVTALGGEFSAGPGKERGYVIKISIPVHGNGNDPGPAG